MHCEEWRPATCTNGVAIPLNQKCNGVCNEHLNDKYRDSRSYVAACGNTSNCVKEGEGITGIISYRPTICTGDSNCEGELAWCRDNERKNETCPVGFARCSPTLGGSTKKGNGSETNRIPGQCIEEDQAQDGRINHCLDRTDENPFKEAGNSKNQTKIDFTQLESCIDENGYPGLECRKEGGNCIDMGSWCTRNQGFRKECPVLGKDILTNNPTVCREYTFWQDKPCWVKDFIRCKAGHSGQCVWNKYWGIEEAKDRNGFEESCKDGSDLFKPIVKAEETSTPQVWKTRPVHENNLHQKGEEERTKYKRDSSTGLWVIEESDPFKVPSVTEENFEKGLRWWKRKEEWVDFYKSDFYLKDETTNLMMAPVTEETCKANDASFLCKVRLGIYDDHGALILDIGDS